MITKTKYRTSVDVKNLVNSIVSHFDGKILKDMESNHFVKFNHEVVDGKNRLIVEQLNF